MLEEKIEQESGIEVEVWKANECLFENEKLAVPSPVFDEFWRFGELAMLFGAPGTGKSVLAVQLADALARGRGMDGFDMQEKGRKVLYVDLDGTDIQFNIRCVAPQPGDKRPLVHTFSERFSRACPPDTDPEKFEPWLRRAIAKVGAWIVIIDSIDAFRQTADGTRDTLKVMRSIKPLAEELGVSILVLTDSGEPGHSGLVAERDLKRSRILCGVADSVFALGRHPRIRGRYYLVQTRSRNSAIYWTEPNPPMCSLGRSETGLLSFIFDERFQPRFDKEETLLIRKIKGRRDAGETWPSIAEEFDISSSRVRRLYKKWAPTMGAPLKREVPKPPVVVAVEEPPKPKLQQDKFDVLAYAGGQRIFEGDDDYEPPDDHDNDIDYDRDRPDEDLDETDYAGVGLDDAESDPEIAELIDTASAQIANVAKRRTIHDLKQSYDARGEEIFVERESSNTGNPEIWYKFATDGTLVKRTRIGSTIVTERLGKSPYL